MEKIEIKQYFLTPPEGSLHFTMIDKADFSSNLSSGLCILERGLLQGATDIEAWSNSQPKRSDDIIYAGLKRTHQLCGDTLYDILITMTSPQLTRYPLFYGQGNFGWWHEGRSECDYAASSCFTEAILSPLGERIAKSLNDKLHPFPFPTLLVEGSEDYEGSIPSHNLSEVIDACLAMLDNPDITVDELMNYIQGPDFPAEEFEVVSTTSTLKKIYETGKGRIIIKNGKGEKRFFKVNMYALDDNYEYKHFNLREYLQMFIFESRKNIVEFAKAMLAQMQKKETAAKQDSMDNEMKRYELLQSSQSEIDNLLRQQLNEVKEMFGDERNTRIRLREQRTRKRIDLSIWKRE